MMTTCMITTRSRRGRSRARSRVRAEAQRGGWRRASTAAVIARRQTVSSPRRVRVRRSLSWPLTAAPSSSAASSTIARTRAAVASTFTTRGGPTAARRPGQRRRRGRRRSGRRRRRASGRRPGGAGLGRVDQRRRSSRSASPTLPRSVTRRGSTAWTVQVHHRPGLPDRAELDRPAGTRPVPGVPSGGVSGTGSTSTHSPASRATRLKSGGPGSPRTSPGDRQHHAQPGDAERRAACRAGRRARRSGPSEAAEVAGGRRGRRGAVRRRP